MEKETYLRRKIYSPLGGLLCTEETRFLKYGFYVYIWHANAISKPDCLLKYVHKYFHGLSPPPPPQHISEILNIL